MKDGLGKHTQMNRLFDCYRGFLTDKQAEFMAYYYQEDLSYQEIADNLAISKAAIYDTIKRAETILVDCEKKVGKLALSDRIDEAINQLKALELDQVDAIVDDFIKEKDNV